MKRPKHLANIVIPKTKQKSDYEIHQRNMTRGELYIVCRDFSKACMNDYVITGSFALELHASKQNAPIHRIIHDVDFMVKDMSALALMMEKNDNFDIAKSSLHSGEDNAWIYHNSTGFIVDIVQAGHRFGNYRDADVETINGFRVAPIDTLRDSLLNRGDNRGDISFINSINC